MNADHQDRWMQDQLNYRLGGVDIPEDTKAAHHQPDNKPKAWRAAISAIFQRKSIHKPYVAQVNDGIKNINYRLIQTPTPSDIPTEPVFIAPQGKFDKPKC